MSIDYNKLLKDFWKLPALIAGLEAHNKGIPVNPYVQEIWDREDWDIEGALKIIGLVKHELLMSGLQAYNVPIRLNDDDYTRLRQALGHYTKSTMNIPTQLMSNLVPYEDDNTQILDYGGGEGRYLSMILDVHPNKEIGAVVVDKALPDTHLRHIFYIQRDFKQETHWYKDGKLNFLDTFDLILINEVLHCQGYPHLKYLIDSSLEMLKSGGWIVIGERIPTPEFQWRMSLATQGGSAITEDSLLTWLNSYNDMEWITMCSTTTHYFIRGQKT